MSGARLLKRENLFFLEDLKEIFPPGFTKRVFANPLCVIHSLLIERGRSPFDVVPPQKKFAEVLCKYNERCWRAERSNPIIQGGDEPLLGKMSVYTNRRG